jgi:hypothetical protein
MCMPSGSRKTARKDENAGGERRTDCSAAKQSDELPPPHRLAPAPRPTPQHFRWARAVPYTSKLEGSLMSALDHKRTSRHFRIMSALPPKADIHNSVVAVRDYRLGCAPPGTHWLASNTACSDEGRCLPLAKTLPRTYERPALRKSFAAFPAASNVA